MKDKRIEQITIAIVPSSLLMAPEVAYTITFVKNKIAVIRAKIRKVKK